MEVVGRVLGSKEERRGGGRGRRKGKEREEGVKYCM